MCNRYAADIRKAGLERDYYGFEEWSETRLNVILEVFPKSVGPVIARGGDGELAWRRMRWGLPGPASTGGAPVTNIRNVASPHWRPLLGPPHTCLVPFTAFSEYDDSSPKGAKLLRWFAAKDRRMLHFAGIWRRWRGDYGGKKVPDVGERDVFAFLTTAANDLVRPVHAKAMPVILRDRAECEQWLSAETARIEAIQARVLPNAELDLLSDDETAEYVGGYIK
jgi:putative SOS response-associated peptidase YedK